jgi:hypothetical protein
VWRTIRRSEDEGGFFAFRHGSSHQRSACGDCSSGDRVTVVLGERDAGGTWYVPGGHLGNATLGLSNIKGSANAQFATAANSGSR